MLKELARITPLVCALGIAGLTACSDDASSAPAQNQVQGDGDSSSATTAEPASSSTDVPDVSSSAVTPASSGDLPSSSSTTQQPSSSVGPTSSSETPASSSADLSSCSASLPASSSAATSSSSISEPAGAYLWNDEFDGTAIDTSKWAFEIGTGSSGWGNNEKEYYTARKENAYVQDGILHIRANKEDYEGSKYTSARMITKGKFTFTYGTVEARIALPVGKGIWPAFWMLGENIDAVSWPACGEIDIIEAVNDEHVVYGTNHWSNNGEHAQYGKNTKDYYGTSKELDITVFHTYKLTWDKKLITVYVDDFKYHEISIEDNAGNTDAFHKPFFFLLNVAVGGNWPGFEIDDSQFPNEMLVDYIRVYKAENTLH